MYFAYTLVLLVAVVTASAFEALHPRGPGPESSRCYTRVAATQAHHGISTDWHTSYTHCTVTSTKVITTTITPRSTVTKTVKKTSTLSTASTVPAPATFTAIQTSLPNSTYGGSGGADPVGKREIDNTVFVKRASSNKPGLVPHAAHHRYAQGVSCYRWKPECATKVVTSTETITKHSTWKLKTVTTTKTVTSTTYTTTVYAACATNNLADTYEGTPIGEVTGGFTSVFDTNTTTAYDCCVAAITMADTSVWAFEPNPFPGEGANCFIGQTDDTCPAPATNPSTAESGFGDLVIGNSYCGEVNADVPIVVSSSAPVKARRAAPTAH